MIKSGFSGFLEIIFHWQPWGTSNIAIWHYINCTVNMRLTVSEKSVFPTSFGRGRFQGNLFSFEKR